MAILTYINKIPLYSTVNEALTWAQTNSLEGYHVHKYKDVAGYMGGYHHKNASGLSTSTTTYANTSTISSRRNIARTQQTQQTSSSTPAMGDGY